MESCGEICGTALPKLDMPLWAEFYLGLERLDEAWTEALYLLKNSGTEEAVRFPDGIKYRRLTEYFIYRHFASAGSREKAAAMLHFSVLSVAVIYALETLGMDCEEAVRLYSSEIEYSDENIELITDKIGENERN